MVNCKVCGSKCDDLYTRTQSIEGHNHVWVCTNGRCKTSKGLITWNGWSENKTKPDSNPACTTYITDLKIVDYPEEQVEQTYYR